MTIMTKISCRGVWVVLLGLVPCLMLAQPVPSQSPTDPVGPMWNMQALSQPPKVWPADELEHGEKATAAPGRSRSTNPACMPVKRTDWAASSAAVYRATNPAAFKKADQKVVFLGDSITQLWHTDTVNGWEGGTPVWEKYYAALPAANFGIAGDKTENVLWRITEGGDLDGMAPKVLVLLIGVNNLLPYGGKNSPGQTAEGITFLVDCLKKKLPETKILLLGIFPCGERAEDPMREKIRRTNQSISKLGDLKQVFYLEIGNRFVEPDGTLTKEKVRDFVHLSEKGYGIWAEAMQPYLVDLLNNEGKGAIWEELKQKTTPGIVK